MIILTILFCISLAALGYTQWRFLQLQKQYGEFLQGADAKKIEDLIKSYSGDVKDSLQKLDELDGFTAKLHTQAQFAISKQALIRFNPFGDTGGDQSFVAIRRGLCRRLPRRTGVAFAGRDGASQTADARARCACGSML